MLMDELKRPGELGLGEFSLEELLVAIGAWAVQGEDAVVHAAEAAEEAVFRREVRSQIEIDAPLDRAVDGAGADGQILGQGIALAPSGHVELVADVLAARGAPRGEAELANGRSLAGQVQDP